MAEGATQIALWATGVASTSSVATTVHCSNLGASTSTLTVEIYGRDGSLDCTVSTPVATGQTRTVSTVNTVFFLEDGWCEVEPTTTQGSLVIKWSPPTTARCVVQEVEPDSATPPFLDTLNLFDASGVYLGWAIFDDNFERGTSAAWSTTAP